MSDDNRRIKIPLVSSDHVKPTKELTVEELKTEVKGLRKKVDQLEVLVNKIMTHLDQSNGGDAPVTQISKSTTMDSNPKPKSKKAENKMSEQDRQTHERKMQQVEECKHVMMLYMRKHWKAKHRFFRDELFTDRYSKKVTKLALTALVEENVLAVDYEETDEGRTAFVSMKLDVGPVRPQKENVELFWYLQEKGI